MDFITEKDIGRRIIYSLYDDETPTNYGEIVSLDEKSNTVTVRLDNLRAKSDGKIIECSEDLLVFDYARDKNFNIVVEDD